MYGTPGEIPEAHKPSAGEHYVLTDNVSRRDLAPTGPEAGGTLSLKTASV
jgi:hypothetical protein